jgi:nitroreductase
LKNNIKAKLYAYFFWQTNIGEYLNKLFDLSVFLKYSFRENKFKNKENVEAFLTKQYHIIEKGLALPESRKYFGKPKIKNLILEANKYIFLYGKDRIVKNIQGTLKVYLDRNIGLEENDKYFYDLIANFISGNDGESIGGVKRVQKLEIHNAIDFDYEKFVKSRSSVRFFSTKNILDTDVHKAIEFARFAPSVCNRQSWKVHYYKDRSIMDKLLKLQNGNNGFNQSINKLLIVTSDVKRFTKLESNQIFVDGGLFAMSLLYSLHAQGIASCCLNTCLPYVDELSIKNEGGIPSSERLIMMIGIGMHKDTYEVAISDRVSVEEILLQH